MSDLPKIVVILGPTASGKTDLAIKIAKKFSGEVVSMDSRQVYTKMDIGTAKPKGEWIGVDGRRVFLVDGISHHLMDIIDPNREISLAAFKAMAIEIINDIIKRGKLPILVGGTGLYFWAVVDNLLIPKISPDKKLRQELGEKSLADLKKMLEEIDPESSKTVDLNNPRRIIRALEVKILSGESFASMRKVESPIYEALQIGVRLPLPELYGRINNRVDQQVKNGLVEEVKSLVNQNYGWELSSMSSIGYRQIGDYLLGKISLEEAEESIKKETRHYAKRQNTWFKRDKRINWIDGPNELAAEELIKNFLKYPVARERRD